LREEGRGRPLKREDIQNKRVTLSQGNILGKPCLYTVEAGGKNLVVKDVRGKFFPVRWTLGLWLIQREWKIYCRLAGIKGIPRPVARIDRFAFTMEFVPGKPIQRGETLSATFFHELGQVLEKVHSRGVVHMDLRHKGNILITERGEPFLIDFNSSFAFKENGFFRRYLFPFLRRVDYGGLLKLKQRVCPSSMTPEESARLRRLNRLRRLWIFN
jgi:predicted Ser/Thr protein kinase